MDKNNEYINREAAIKEVYRFDDYLDDDLEWRLHYALKKLPAANVVEVIHAHWIDENPEDLLDVRMRCSNCRTIHAPYAHWHYCPSCGAAMRE